MQLDRVVILSAEASAYAVNQTCQPGDATGFRLRPHRSHIAIVLI